MGVGETFKGLPMGAKVIVVILTLVLSAHALGILSLIVIGVMADVALSGDIDVPAATNTTINTTLDSYNTLVGVVLSPFSTIASLVIVVVLLAIFFRGKMPGMGSGGGVA